MSKVGAHNYFKIHMLYPMEMIPTFASHPCGLNHNRQMHSKKMLRLSLWQKPGYFIFPTKIQKQELSSYMSFCITFSLGFLTPLASTEGM